MNIEIVAGLSQDLTNDLNDGHLDIALIREIVTADNADLLCKSKLVWFGPSDFTLPKDGVLPLAHVHGPCSYFNVAKQTLTAAEIPWKSTVSYTSLHGLMAMIKVGIAVCVVLRADCPENTLAANHMNLPDLPGFSLKIHFASSDASHACKVNCNGDFENIGANVSMNRVRGVLLLIGAFQGCRLGFCDWLCTMKLHLYLFIFWLADRRIIPRFAVEIKVENIVTQLFAAIKVNFRKCHFVANTLGAGDNLTCRGNDAASRD